MAKKIKKIVLGEEVIDAQGPKGDTGETGATGPQGPEGPQGATGIYDPNDQETPAFELDTEKGDSTIKGMTQKAITEAVDEVGGKLSSFLEDSTIDVYRNSKVVDGQTVYENDYYKTNANPYTSAIACSQMTAAVSTDRVFNRIEIGPIKRRSGTDSALVYYRVCIKGTNDDLVIPNGGVELRKSFTTLTGSYKTVTLEFDEAITLHEGERVCVYFYILDAATPKLQLASATTNSAAKFNSNTQIMYYTTHDGGLSSTSFSSETDAFTRKKTSSTNGWATSSYYAPAPVLRYYKAAGRREVFHDALVDDDDFKILKEDTDKSVYRVYKTVDNQPVYEDDYYKAQASSLDSTRGVMQMTFPFYAPKTFNQVIIGPYIQNQGLEGTDINYRICIKNISSDNFAVAGGGTLLAEGTVKSSFSYQQIAVTLPEDVTVGIGDVVCVYMFRIGYDTPKIIIANKSTSTLARFSSRTNGYYYVSASTGSAFSDMNDALTRTYTGPSTTYYCASPILKYVKDSTMKTIANTQITANMSSIITQTRTAISGVKVWLPSKIYAVVGDTLQLFYKGIVEAPDPYKYAIFAQCNIGFSWKRYFEVTPKASQVGTKTLTIFVKDADGNILGQASTQLVIKAAPSSPQTAKKILCLGASTTEHGEWPNELKRRLINTNAVNGISGLGLQNVSVKYYGRHGWTWGDFISAPAKQYRITVEGVEGVSVGATYTNDGNTYTIKEVNLTDGTGNILLEGSAVTPQANGVLTLTSESGAPTITMLTVTVEQENPLWDVQNDKFSFIPWVEEQGGVDVLYVLLNGNGLKPWDTFTMSSTGRVANMKTFARKFNEEYPNAKLVFVGPTMPSQDGGMAENYGAKGMADAYGMAKACWNLARFYKEFVNDAEFSSYTDFADVTTQFDCEYNYPKTFRAANRRWQNSTSVADVNSFYKVYRDSNGLHPEMPGYYQIADALYRHFIGEYL